MNIGRRLGLGFGAAILLFLMVGAMSLYSLARLAEADRWNVHSYEVIGTSNDMMLAITTMRGGLRGYLLAGDEAQTALWSGGDEDFQRSWGEAKTLTADNLSQQTRLDQLRAQQRDYKAAGQAMMALRRDVTAGSRTMQSVIDEFRTERSFVVFDAARNRLNEFEAAEQEMLRARSAESDRVRALNRETVVFGSLTALLLAALLGVQITRSITRPINDQLIATLDRLAAGELTARVGLERSDELGKIGVAIDQMAGNLQQAHERERQARDQETADAQALRDRVDRLVDVTERAAGGNLVMVPMVTGDETTQRMSDGVHHMVGGLRSLVVNLQGSMVQIRSSINQLSASVRETETTVTEQAATATEVAASTTEITQTARDLAQTMTQISRSSEAAVGVADEGQHSLRRMDETLSNIVAASSAIAGRLAVVGEKAGTISSVTSTITKVADQTNLLSLNAAIEAEKAGESGQGFSVIATEIRRLADQTSVAAGDIEQIIKEMQGAVSASVMSMDKFNDEVQRNVGDVKTISQVLHQVIEHVKATAPQLEMLSQGMLAQSDGATQINQAIRQFTESIKLNTQTARNTEQATSALGTVAERLQSGISSFQVD